LSQEFRDVVAFEEACGIELSSGRPSAPDLKTIQLRKRLIKEEYDELTDALTRVEQAVATGCPVTDEMLADVADGSADLQWVCKGTDIACGIDGPAVWREVARANHSKFDDGHWFDEGGKLRKSKLWQPPDIAGVLASQRPLAETYSIENQRGES
jgi:predicted HAD superfamily Cof-like phosphohydrolase